MVQYPRSNTALGIDGSISVEDRAAAIGQRVLLPVNSLELPGSNDSGRYDDSALDALAASIVRWGQLQPVIVRRVADRFQIVCGGRRWLAVKRAGLTNLWVEECTATDLEALAMRLADNLHHVGLSHAERVAALDQLSELVGSGGLRTTARLIGTDPAWLSRQLRVRADPVLFPALEAGRIGFGQAAELCRAPVERRGQLLERVLDSDGRVATATIRNWVAEARAEMGARISEPSVANRVTEFNALVDQLQTLGVPKNEKERGALERLATVVHRLMSSPQREESDSPPEDSPIKMSQTELSCILCGELAGLRDESGVLHVVSPSGVNRRGRQLRCGRCGGGLTDGAVRVEYRRHTSVA